MEGEGDFRGEVRGLVCYLDYEIQLARLLSGSNDLLSSQASGKPVPSLGLHLGLVVINEVLTIHIDVGCAMPQSLYVIIHA